MTSSVTVLQALLWETLSVYDQIVIKNLKRSKDVCQTNFSMKFDLKDDLRMEFVLYSNEMMQEGALALFADLYHTNAAHEE